MALALVSSSKEIKKHIPSTLKATPYQRPNVSLTTVFNVLQNLHWMMIVGRLGLHLAASNDKSEVKTSKGPSSSMMETGRRSWEFAINNVIPDLAQYRFASSHTVTT